MNESLCVGVLWACVRLSMCGHARNVYLVLNCSSVQCSNGGGELGICSYGRNHEDCLGPKVLEAGWGAMEGTGLAQSPLLWKQQNEGGIGWVQAVEPQGTLSPVFDFCSWRSIANFIYSFIGNSRRSLKYRHFGFLILSWIFRPFRQAG